MTQTACIAIFKPFSVKNILKLQLQEMGYYERLTPSSSHHICLHKL
jgi:hypothetical protein